MSIDVQELEVAILLTAKIVARHGEKYLPIFERLEDELATARSNSERLDRALEMARPPAD